MLKQKINQKYCDNEVVKLCLPNDNQLIMGYDELIYYNQDSIVFYGFQKHPKRNNFQHCEITNEKPHIFKLNKPYIIINPKAAENSRDFKIKILYCKNGNNTYSNVVYGYFPVSLDNDKMQPTGKVSLKTAYELVKNSHNSILLNNNSVEYLNINNDIVINNNLSFPTQDEIYNETITKFGTDLREEYEYYKDIKNIDSPILITENEERFNFYKMKRKVKSLIQSKRLKNNIKL